MYKHTYVHICICIRVYTDYNVVIVHALCTNTLFMEFNGMRVSAYYFNSHKTKTTIYRTKCITKLNTYNINQN